MIDILRLRIGALAGARSWLRAWVVLPFVLAFALPGAAAHAGDSGPTFLAWWACSGDRQAAPGVPFDCVPESGTVYTLVGTFALDHDIANAVSMEADVNIAFPGVTTVPSFWDVDPAGCNPTSFATIKGVPRDCGDHVNAFCGGDSNSCDLVYSTSSTPSSNVMRILITAGVGGSNPVQLQGGQRYFAFAINIPMNGASSCLGCTTPCAIGFTQARIYSVDDAGQANPPAIVSGAYPGANACATANDGYSECVTVPVRRMTWGRLKSLYR